MKKSVMFARCAVVYLAAVAAPFLVTEFLVGYANDWEMSTVQYNPKAADIIAQKLVVKSLEGRVDDLESGARARRIAAITQTKEEAIALEDRLSGRVETAKNELEQAKVKLARLAQY